MNTLGRLSPTEYGHVAVCAGGDSAERAVSLNSGAAVLQGLHARGISAELVDLDQDFYPRAIAAEFDRVFIAIHGRGGEDGALQGFLDLLKLPYTGSGLAASVLAMNKQLSKSIWHLAGLATPAWRQVNGRSELHAAANELGLPLMVKPVSEGSSVGISLVEEQSQLDDAWLLADACDQPVITEQFIDGNEYTLAIVQGQPLPLIKITTPNRFYDYQAKYASEQTGYHCPSGLSEQSELVISNLAMQAFAAIGGSGWGRVDFMVDGQGKPWLVEANTVPGLTDHSLVPMAARAFGWQLEELIERILQSSFSHQPNLIDPVGDANG
ncbi:MAG: D-alanine--D-alanine ligase [Immundisolibacteraceae bacterium]|nr:D-alanine--D-alanine ligase [Immundisolibacteraceae bacterium]